MRHLAPLLLLGGAASSIASSDPPRPRGVGPEFAKFYKQSKETFTCITAPSVVIPLSSVNDDYCDCPDGSDEPGTSACSYLSGLSPSQPVPGTATDASNATLALPGYYCKNKGHRPGYVPSNFVNDGVCDYTFCCDGSDEWAGVGGTKCEDRCVEIGAEWRKRETERVVGMRAALQEKAELVRKAELQGLMLQDRLNELEVMIGALEEKEKGAQMGLEDVEKREKLKAIEGGDKKATKTTLLAKLAKARVEELRNGLVDALAKKEASRARILELEGILATFREEYNPNYNDAGVKRAVKAWEDYVANKTPDSEAEEADLQRISEPDSEASGINWAEWENEGESDVEALYRFEEYLPSFIRDWLHDKKLALRQFLVDNKIISATSTSDSDSKSVHEARDTLTGIQSDIREKKGELEVKRKDANADYGPQGIFRALKDECASLEAGEYIYEFCFLGRTTQKSLKSGAETSLGDFRRLQKVHVDEHVPVDGRGLGSGERWAMVFEEGTHCWNGPQRSTTVIMACKEKAELWRVVEAEKCVYRMEVGTPAVCEEEPAGKIAAGKDEL